MSVLPPVAARVLICAAVVACSLSSLVAVWAAPPPDALASVRVGLVDASGTVAWPVEPVAEGANWFAPERWRDRDVRRRRWSDLTNAELEGLPGLFRPDAVTVVDGARSVHAEVVGLGRMDAGCGETEVVWQARLAGPSPAQRSHAWSELGTPTLVPVLIVLRGGSPFDDMAMPVATALPTGLRARLSAHSLDGGIVHVLRSGPYWTVYGARPGARGDPDVGVARSIWQTADGYRLRHQETTNDAFEGMAVWFAESPRKRFVAFVGQVHGWFRLGTDAFFLTSYRGWESLKFVVERLRDGALQTVLVSGLDRGC